MCDGLPPKEEKYKQCRRSASDI